MAVTVTGTIYKADGTPYTGTVKFIPDRRLRVQNDLTVTGAAVTTTVTDGALNVSLEPGRYAVLIEDKATDPTVILVPSDQTQVNLDDIITGSSVEGWAGIALHDDLLGRDAADQHPINAITGLQSSLDSKANQTDLDAHTSDINNPHQVTYAQVGADPAGTAAAEVANHEAKPDPHPQYAKAVDLSGHTSRTDNPHNVTYAQVGADPAGTAQSLIATHESAYDHLLIPTALQKAALDAAQDPSGTNAFLTVSAAAAGHAKYWGELTVAELPGAIDGAKPGDMVFATDALTLDGIGGLFVFNCTDWRHINYRHKATTDWYDLVKDCRDNTIVASGKKYTVYTLAAPINHDAYYSVTGGFLLPTAYSDSRAAMRFMITADAGTSFLIYCSPLHNSARRTSPHGSLPLIAYIVDCDLPDAVELNGTIVTGPGMETYLYGGTYFGKINELAGDNYITATRFGGTWTLIYDHGPQTPPVEWYCNRLTNEIRVNGNYVGGVPNSNFYWFTMHASGIGVGSTRYVWFIKPCVVFDNGA